MDITVRTHLPKSDKKAKLWKLQFRLMNAEGGFMFFSNLLASSMWEDITNYFANFNGATNICRTVILWISIALVIAFAVCKFAVKKDKQPKVNKVALIVAIAYSAISIITFAVCSFVEDEIVAMSFYPLLVFIVVAVVGGLLIVVKPVKAVKIAVASTIGAAFVAAFVCLIVYYTSGDASEWNWISQEDVNDVGLYVSAAILAVGIVLLAIFADRGAKPFDSRSISYAAICVALSFALSYVRFFKMPMGGSITFASMLPVMIYSYMFGTRKGAIAGLILGALQAVQDPWILHPAQFILDYGTAFTAVGLAGCIKGFGALKGKARSQFTLGAVIAGVLRFVSHFLSGAFAFGSAGVIYAEEYGIPALSNPYLYSFVYQCLYVIPEIIIVVVVGVILLSSKNFLRQIEKYSNDKKAAAVVEETPADGLVETSDTVEIASASDDQPNKE